MLTFSPAGRGHNQGPVYIKPGGQEVYAIHRERGVIPNCTPMHKDSTLCSAAGIMDRSQMSADEFLRQWNDVTQRYKSGLLSTDAWRAAVSKIGKL